MDPRDQRALEQARDSARIAIGHLESGGPDWRADQKTIDAVAKRVEDSSEKLRRVSPAQQAAMPGVPWKAAKGIREILAHDYGTLDLDILEQTVRRDLPELIAAIDAEIGQE
jgi:uncharacterized protein with HEPN domain